MLCGCGFVFFNNQLLDHYLEPKHGRACHSHADQSAKLMPLAYWRAIAYTNTGSWYMTT